MNQLLDSMLNRNSCRSYVSGKEISHDHMEFIMKAAQQSPTYIGGQQYTVIAISDQALKDKMLELTMPSSGVPQKWVAECSVFLLFVMDFSKLEGIFKKQGIENMMTDYLESLLIGSVDVGIGAEAAVVAAEALGYGTVVIGAVRKSPEELIKAFDLPEKTYPIIGVCVGHKKSSESVEPKPRLPLSSFVHHNKYQKQDWDAIIEAYDQTISEYMIRVGKPTYVWSDFVKTYYGKTYWMEQSEAYKKQGFDLK